VKRHARIAACATAGASPPAVEERRPGDGAGRGRAGPGARCVARCANPVGAVSPYPDTAGMTRVGYVLLLLATGLAAGCASAPSGSWRPLTTPGTASLRGIAVVDASTVWVSGSGGTVWRTEDGGASWSAVAPPGTAASDFRDVEVLADGTALVMTAGSPG